MMRLRLLSRIGNFLNRKMVFPKVVQKLLPLLAIAFLTVALGSNSSIKEAYYLPVAVLLSCHQGTKPIIVTPDSHQTSSSKSAMSRKTRPPLSWLATVRDAEAAFVGEASLTKDTAASASETSFRGKGYHLTSKIDVQRTLFGSSSETSLTLEGDTQRAPEQRLSAEAASFPPDTFYHNSYWDYAQVDRVQPVLVFLGQPVVVIHDPEANFLEAIQLIKSWLSLPASEQRSQVLSSLAEPGKHPVAYVAGFELLMAESSSLPDLFAAFDNLPTRPGEAIQGIVDKLYIVATGLTDSEIKALGQQLLASWSRESSPAALSSYLVWFDAHRQRTWVQGKGMQQAVQTQAERSKVLRFSGEDSNLWEQRVQQYASALLN